ncbi:MULTISPECIES: type II toxin-antitoxin system HipA family toxin [unclassified Sinorhizobium]|uniref:type II toxin-antitoxin system HipA family toxin n=1 Tax=unclassified Sinorhizobium TaxID=2613772 RepID=UPI0024C32C1D|nr:MULTISPECIES: type II toxin-antitoxin system HipA family toxin [unclassified Sinorhizobium]MDK1378115.1 type II toxin-antitoxin system HipA family toxin [Sinorhizobium sp. 6-70]MDK1481738.1 type II toxin-antitoxin system HipA family toxin [Sinorhizobium sp. 6-117]
MTTKVLNVWWDGRIVGRFAQDGHGDISFDYAQAWLEDDSALALSASLPKRAECFTRQECRPFFGGLLPEESQREAAAQALGVSPANDYALLDRLGGDVAGALQLLTEGQELAEARSTDHQPAPLDDAGIVRVLEALPVRPLLAGEGGLRLSLAGSQSKVPVVLVNGHIALPLAGHATTHIVKPPIARFKATTENEAFAMRLAADIGLDVAPVEPRSVQGRSFLLVARYDRLRAASGVVHRIHQEDFCQALGVPPETKYANEGGPTFKECFELLRRVSARPAGDVLKLLDAAIFNVIIGNADAHGKNFSILYDEQGPRLAPLYDVLSTVAFPELSPNMAMRMGKSATLTEMDADSWQAFASEVGVGFPLLRRRIGELCDGMAERAVNVAEALVDSSTDPTAVLSVAELVTSRATLARLTC